MKHFNSGRIHTEKQNREHSEAMKGRIPWNKGKHGVQDQTKRSGKNHPMFGKYGKDGANWKGGLTPLNILIRESARYSIWRTNIYERDMYTCQYCKKIGCELEAHHLEKFSHLMKINNIKTFESALSCEKLWDLNNGITLCRECHKKLHRRRIITNEMVDLL